ncbi:hypothetical protein DEO72_LG3g1745 [Vigna unguiculata]|uniref:Uncharacterized protein n=1 Tax=Vigna unguiculata TaxID=3917 RepID=A0A4D6LF29_VIGUN|nr:hypothetical protein DEO72_LG3g1745 [Vigna unguiculata]
MEGCHVIISISQNPNPNFLLSFHPPWQPPPSPRRKLQNHHRLQQRATVSSPSSRLCATVLATTTDRASTIATPFPSSRNSSYAATTMPFHLRSRATNAAAMAAENADLHQRSIRVAPSPPSARTSAVTHSTRVSRSSAAAMVAPVPPFPLQQPSRPSSPQFRRVSTPMASAPDRRRRARRSIVAGEEEKASRHCRQSNWSTGQLWSTGQSQQSTLVKTANIHHLHEPAPSRTPPAFRAAAQQPWLHQFRRFHYSSHRDHLLRSSVASPHPWPLHQIGGEELAGASSPEKKKKPAQPREEGGRGRNPNSGERVLCATCQHLIG